MNEYGKKVAKKMEDYSRDPNSIDEEIRDIQNAKKGYEVRGALGSGVSKSFNKSKDAENRSLEQTDRVDRLIRENPQPSEVVDARGGHPILGDRLNATDQQLAETIKAGDEINTVTSGSVIKQPIDIQDHNLKDSESLPFHYVYKKEEVVVFKDQEISRNDVAFERVDISRYKKFTVFLSYDISAPVVVRFRVGLEDVPLNSFRVKKDSVNDNGSLPLTSPTITLSESDINGERIIILDSEDIFKTNLVLPNTIEILTRADEEGFEGKATCVVVGEFV